MNPAQLLEHFDRISEAPDAVARLRRFILDLAVRGKLVEQDPNDEPATELLKRIQAEKVQLVKEGKAKKEKPLAPIEADEAPFSVPVSWTWTRLQDITSYIQRGKSPAYATEDGFPVVSQKCVQWRGFDLSAARLITKESIGKYEDVRFLRENDLLWNSTGTGTIGRVVKVISPPGNLVCDSHVTVVRCALVDPEYVRSWLRCDHVYLLIEDRAAGSTNQVELTAQMATAQVVPIPPLAEQHRIVAKVDELMVLCDQLEAAKNEREARRDRLVAASLHRIGTAPAAADKAATETPSATPLRDAARFHLDHLPRLTTRPEHIKQLRQTILDLVFQGCLTSRLDEDGLGIDLVNEIHRQWEAEAFTKARAGKSKPTAKFECEPAFFAPETWGWIRLQILCEQIGDIDHKMPRAVSVGVPFLSAKDLKDSGELDFSDPKYISEEDFTRLSRKILPRRDDIIYSRIGARLGKARLVEVDTRFLISYSCCLIRPKHQFVDKRFLQTFLDSHLALRQAHSGVQSIGVPDLGLGEIKAYRIPMPSLTEQHRIVAKVDELMALCDQLEAQLTTTQTDNRRLLEAVLHEALAAAA